MNPDGAARRHGLAGFSSRPAPVHDLGVLTEYAPRRYAGGKPDDPARVTFDNPCGSSAQRPVGRGASADQPSVVELDKFPAPVLTAGNLARDPLPPVPW